MTRLYPVVLLLFSNVFMIYAWYGHLKDMRTKPLIIAIVLSWGVAFFEYCLQVPANRIGHQYYSLGQLKVMQEIITMSVFAVFSVMYMKEKVGLDYLLASLCMVGAVYFMFRSNG
ncbi:protein of unknown function DUF486 [Denitrovibrio acetiphilus DSM 12809]|uniref:DMT family protein n=1 Tax=Denitrovibrio acetiphilus (strain DSM 12809 / NBRC 114555 / N2460) TaxID=522772 RepID=D4H7Q5_DENA2|nr:DMT family protein [Denitrovibrio acetiphilus]ADD68054.1 protein of unknown function DUF486 [Denitrovibrio acetiphilus DSM 12809]